MKISKIKKKVANSLKKTIVATSRTARKLYKGATHLKVHRMNIVRKMLPLRTAFTKIVETVGSVRNNSNAEAATKRLVVEPLSERELVRVQGEEVVPFLQGLITNDISHLQTGQFNVGGPAAMYSMFLNKAGRVLYDSIIYRTAEPTSYLIECDKQISTELRRHLRLYRVRREIQIDSVDDEYKPWILFNPDDGGEVCFDISRLSADYFYTPDPRVRDLGLRVLTRADKTWSDLAKVFSTPGEVVVSPPTKEANYRLHRYRFGIGEGVYDLPPGKCFPLEANADFLHGVSFHKGCYIGQELTARVYHTGTVRKRLMPLALTKPVVDKNAVIKTTNGTTVGALRGVVAESALALLRVEHVLNNAQLLIEGEPCLAKKPKWWPTELPKRLKERGFS